MARELRAIFMQHIGLALSAAHAPTHSAAHASTHASCWRVGGNRLALFLGALFHLFVVLGTNLLTLFSGF